MNKENKPKVALVLPGGGALGIYQVEMIKNIMAAFDIELYAISGVSVGALNGSMIAGGQLKRLHELWLSIEEKDILRRRSLMKIGSNYLLSNIGVQKPYGGAYSNDPLFELIQREITPYNKAQSKIHLHIGRVSLKTGEYKKGLTDSRVFHKEVLSSTAIPGVWSPVKIDGELFVDGGVRNIAPLGDVLQYDPDVVIIIPNSPFDKPIEHHGKVETIIDAISCSIKILLNEVIKGDIDHFLTINSLVRQAESGGVELHRNTLSGRRYKCFNHVICTPKRDLGDSLDFSRQSLTMRRRHAYRMFNTVYRDDIATVLRKYR